ncbi:response regulator [Deinococcus malanensis]|uniref:Response regulator n=1 Tax=Deinococcus malanensis TaxID=1706855 RepID=A0ABQ2EV23_9DEIO|nr:response regulator [Deinococcus malanensis]GGK22203.1 response regulator [Deinococcus malanensis]
MESRRILLIDDNPHDVELALHAFAQSGQQHNVVVAGGGSEAVALLHGEAGELPDLILLDLKMPHMDGLAVLDEIRAHDATRRIPVVMLTTSGESRDVRASYEHGASAYVVKPLELRQFAETLKTITAFWTRLNRVAHSG